MYFLKRKKLTTSGMWAVRWVALYVLETVGGNGLKFSRVELLWFLLLTASNKFLLGIKHKRFFSDPLLSSYRKQNKNTFFKKYINESLHRKQSCHKHTF